MSLPTMLLHVWGKIFYLPIFLVPKYGGRFGANMEMGRHPLGPLSSWGTNILLVSRAFPGVAPHLHIAPSFPPHFGTKHIGKYDIFPKTWRSIVGSDITKCVCFKYCILFCYNMGVKLIIQNNVTWWSGSSESKCCRKIRKIMSQFKGQHSAQQQNKKKKHSSLVPQLMTFDVGSKL